MNQVRPGLGGLSLAALTPAGGVGGLKMGPALKQGHRRAKETEQQCVQGMAERGPELVESPSEDTRALCASTSAECDSPAARPHLQPSRVRSGQL